VRIRKVGYIVKDVGEIMGQYCSGGDGQAAGAKVPVCPAVLFCKKEFTSNTGIKG
jgi:hypothetical protein